MPAMNNTVAFYIGLRYIRAKRRNSFISFVSLFAFAGMALGVFALIVVLSVMNGFDREVRERILRVVPHAYVSMEGGIADWPSLQTRLNQSGGLHGSAPYVKGHGLISFDGATHGMQLQGIEPGIEPQVSVVHDHMLTGGLDALEAGEYRIVLGSLLARYLEVTTGDKVSVTLPSVAVTPAGVFPRTRRFTVAGVFEVGAQLDQELALIHIGDAQKLFRRGDHVDGMRLRFEDIYAAAEHIPDVRQALPPTYTVQDWSETQGSLFQAVKMEKTVVGVMLGIIIAVAAFNIVTTLIMMIAEKRSDIAVLRTMGLRARGVIGIFMVQGMVLGLVGIVIGTVLGLLVAFNLAPIVNWFESLLGARIFDPSIYFVTSMPSEVRYGDVVMVCAGAAVVSFLATCYPAWRACLIEPAEALRYNV